MHSESLNLRKILFFDRDLSEYSSGLLNVWSDYEELTKSIRMGCKRRVENLLDFGCRVNKAQGFSSPLYMAVKKGWTSIAKKMLANGARVSDLERASDTPLRYVFLDEKTKDKDDLVNAMLDRHLLTTRMDFVHADGLSFFHIACARGKRKLVEEFLRDPRSNVDRQVSSSATMYAGYTALHFAVEFQRKDILEILLKHKANLYLQDVNGSTPLHLAFYQHNFKAVDRLLLADREKEDMVNNFGLSHFMIACTVDDSFKAEEYLWKARKSHGKLASSILTSRQVKLSTVRSINYPYAFYSPLHFAVEFGRLDTVRMLLTYQANCCATTGKRLTPAALAQQNGHMEIYRVLQEHCANKKNQMAATDVNNNQIDINCSDLSDSDYFSSNSSLYLSKCDRFETLTVN